MFGNYLNCTLPYQKTGSQRTNKSKLKGYKLTLKEMRRNFNLKVKSKTDNSYLDSPNYIKSLPSQEGRRVISQNDFERKRARPHDLQSTKAHRKQQLRVQDIIELRNTHLRIQINTQKRMNEYLHIVMQKTQSDLLRRIERREQKKQEREKLKIRYKTNRKVYHKSKVGFGKGRRQEGERKELEIEKMIEELKRTQRYKRRDKSVSRSEKSQRLIEQKKELKR